MVKINTKKALFTLSGLAIIAIIVMFGRTYFGISVPGLDGVKDVSTVGATGEASTGTAKAGQRFGDWAVACEKEGKKDVCFLQQVLTSKEEAKDSKDSKDKKEEPKIQRVAEFRIGYFGGSKELKMIQILPFGTSLQAGTSIILSKDKLIAPGKFTTCQPFGCLAVADLTDDIETLSTTKEDVFIGIITIEGKQVNIPLSTKGLKDGIDSLK